MRRGEGGLRAVTIDWYLPIPAGQIPPSKKLCLGMSNLPNWRPRADSESRRASAISLARAVLDRRESLLETHFREILKIAVWKYTECDGKYTTRFRSDGALFASGKDIHHEHVIPIRRLVDALVAEPEDVAGIMTRAIGCVVLRSEHKLLGQIEKEHPAADGWTRYQLAGITVWDLQVGRPVRGDSI